MMKRTQLYIQEELHEVLSRFALANGWTLSQAFRKAVEEFVEKPKVKKLISKKNPFANMMGIIKGGHNLASGVDEIYNED